ncbi:MerR family transcriptional regulator [Lactiplantibacillus plantarum]|uniref:MerR family transcriptional regulator n=1 Tax=Lactiplantibacillus plantarum TaxID=1590 RepID=UPI00237ACC8D|nr:MerR family transcriptional regulator [Lactiplantibacillus plantarum]
MRFYEKMGLYQIKRDSNGRRVFNDDDLEWLYFIQQLKAVKMNLKQIKVYGYLKRMGVKTLPQRIDFLYQHQEKLISQQQSLKKIIERMNEKIDKTKKKKTK